MRVFEGLDELRAAVGEKLGVSDWFLVDQAAIDRFAEATNDHYFIHVDPERAVAEAGLEGTIAHGLLTLSLGPGMLYTILEVRGVGSSLNYGYDRVRFTAPVPVGSRVRMACTLLDLEDRGEGARATYRQEFEVEGVEKPVCIADQIGFYWHA